MKKNRVTVLHSGGIDSTATIHFYKKMGYEITSLYIDYGQVSNKYEKKAVKKLSSFYKVKLNIIKVNSNKSFHEGLVSGRNLFLLSAALMYTKMKTGIICIGIHKGTDYIDCSKEFLHNVNQIFTQYSNGKISANAPF